MICICTALTTSVYEASERLQAYFIHSRAGKSLSLGDGASFKTGKSFIREGMPLICKCSADLPLWSTTRVACLFRSLYSLSRKSISLRAAGLSPTKCWLTTCHSSKISARLAYSSSTVCVKIDFKLIMAWFLAIVAGLTTKKSISRVASV